MKNFILGQRIIIDRGPLEGTSGTVARLRRGDRLAWIECDEVAPEHNTHVSTFPVLPDSHLWRSQYVLMLPEHCLSLAAEPAVGLGETW